MSDFQKPEFDRDLDPVTYFNEYREWADAFKGCRLVDVRDELNIAFQCENSILDAARITSRGMLPPKGNRLKLDHKKVYTKFMILSRVRFNGDYKAAISYIEWNFLNKEIPYVRVRTDYFKMFPKKDRYSVPRVTLVPWRKEEIKQDHGQSLLNFVHRFDDFCIEPNNLDFEQVIDNCFNLYSPFPHRPAEDPVTPQDIPVTMNLLNHVFGEQIRQGLIYMKVLYQYPKQALPVLCLVSSERQTGKTTFNNYINVLFGDNFIMINPEDLVSNFNASYATKNIICIDETVLDKSHAIEKLKAVATAKSMNVNQKHVSNYMVPFFGKIIISTNKETDFIRVDQEEIRFWVRKIKSISKIDTDIESKLVQEIPLFLRYLLDLPAIDFSKSRMVLTAEEIENDYLKIVKEESRSTLHKELLMLLEEFFNKSPLESVQMTAMDIKNHWFSHNNQITAGYIAKVVRHEMNLSPTEKATRYRLPWDESNLNNNVGRPFTFNKSDYTDTGVTLESPSDYPPF